MRNIILALAVSSICWGSSFAQVRFDATGGTVFLDSGNILSTSADNGFTSKPLVTHYNVNGFNVTGVTVGQLSFNTGTLQSGNTVAGTADYAAGGYVVAQPYDPFDNNPQPFIGTFATVQTWRLRTDGSYRLQGTVLGTFDGVNYYTVHFTATTAFPPNSYIGNGQMNIVTATLQ